jgi:hypothetical protein
MLRLPLTGVQLTCPVTFCACPSMRTLVPPAAEVPLAAGGVVVLDLLPEQPASPATTEAAATIPINIPRFATGLLRLVELEQPCLPIATLRVRHMA